MKNIEEFLANPWVAKIGWSIVVIVISWGVYKVLVDVIIGKMETKEFNILTNKKSKTYIRLVKSILRYVFTIGTLLI